MIIRRVKPLSLAKVSAVIYGFFGILVGVFLGLAGMVGSLAGQAAEGLDGGAGLMGLMFGVGAIFMPVIYAAMGFLGGLIAALIYNLIAGWIGGIELEMQ
jgi:hypothetical protein